MFKEGIKKGETGERRYSYNNGGFNRTSINPVSLVALFQKLPISRKMSNGPNANDPIFEGEKRKKKQSPIGAPQTSHSQNLDKIENPRSIC